MFKPILTTLIFASILLAQKPDAGVSTEWDIRKDMTALAAEIRQLQPWINKIEPEKWVSQGAPQSPTYANQLISLQSAVKNLLGSTEKLAREPERLTVALDTYFRIQYVETLLDMVRQGVRKYQSPDLAEILNGQMTASLNSKDKLRTHIMDLASLQEEEMSVMNQEAQRCRSVLSKAPVDVPQSDKRKSQKPELK